MSDRNFFLYDRANNCFTIEGDNILTCELGCLEISGIKPSESLGTNWAISSIWDIASVAHFVTLSSSTFKASEYFLPVGFTSRLFTALKKGACRTYH